MYYSIFLFVNFSVIGHFTLNFYFSQVHLYADDLFGNAGQDTDAGPSGCIDTNCKHRLTKRSFVSSSSDEELNAPCAKKYRSERRHSNTSKAFKETLMKAKKLSNWIWEKRKPNKLHKFTVVTDQGSRYKVEIKSCPSCLWPDFQKEKRSRTRANILLQLWLPKSNHQMICNVPKVAFTQNEVEYLMASLILTEKASKFLKKHRKQPSIFHLPNNSKFLHSNKWNLF